MDFLRMGWVKTGPNCFTLARRVEFTTDGSVARVYVSDREYYPVVGEFALDLRAALEGTAAKPAVLAAG